MRTKIGGLEILDPPKTFMYAVYVLRSKKDKDLYIGYSKDFKKRLVKHNKGKVPATVGRHPFEIVFLEFFKDREDALKRERFLKTGWGRNQLRKILENTLKK